MTLTKQDCRDGTAAAYRRLIQSKREQGDEYAAKQLEKGLSEVMDEWARPSGEHAA